MEFIINREEQQTLLADAREAIIARLEGRSPKYHRSPELAASIVDGRSALTQTCGAFVTIRMGKNLRGCIGKMTAAWPLEKTVQAMALEAAFSDPRFPPLALGEPAFCSLEISALSPMEKCPDPRSVKVGVHGLYLIHRGRSGVLLPQVPLEQGWDLDEYLDYICVKAGLPPASYEAP
jgi:AmmeMemoRadiSam system protein A